MKFRLNLAVLVASAVLLPLAGAGCAESELATTPEEQDIQADPRVAEDAVVLTDVPVDLLPDLPGDQGVEPPEDVTPIDHDEWGECLEGGEPGCPCNGNEDCFSGWCVTTGDGDLCTSICESQCPAGYTCQDVQTSGADIAFICVPLYTNLCRPCLSGSDCKQLGDVGGYCIPQADGSAFCGGQCDEDMPCPEGYECADAQLGETLTVKQCQPMDGECTCNALAVKDSAITTCSQTNASGTCDGGERVCTPDGLSACDAPEPTAETCDGVDEDCDGVSDDEDASVDVATMTTMYPDVDLDGFGGDAV